MKKINISILIAFISLAIGISCLIQIQVNNKRPLKEISVEKINITEKDGTVRLSLFNEENMPEPIINGKKYERSIQGAGLIMYSKSGDERGGMVIFQKDSTEMSGFVCDYRNSEGIAMGRYESGRTSYGTFLNLSERVPLDSDPDTASSVGKTKMNLEVNEKMSEIILNDSKGNTRIIIKVDSTDTPLIQILDETGNVISKL